MRLSGLRLISLPPRVVGPDAGRQLEGRAATSSAGIGDAPADLNFLSIATADATSAHTFYLLASGATDLFDSLNLVAPPIPPAIPV